MKTNFIFTIVLLLMPLVLFAQQSESEYFSTKATIKKIEKKSSGGKVREIATVFYTTKQGQNITTVIELARIPFLGSFKSVGDEITVNYNIANPALVETNTGHFLSKYGMYILIAAGVVFSVMQYMKVRKKYQKQ